MPWLDLMQMRAQTADPAQQALLAPYEHRAYAREEVAANPLMAPVYAAMVPGYQALKLLGVGARTPASWSELGQGWLGTIEGLKQGLGR
jgi:hypothetical protein